MYLPHEIILSTMSELANFSSRGSLLIFDYIDNESFNPEKASPRILSMMQMAQYAGEPIITGFDPLLLAEQVQPTGFRLVETLSPRDIQELYFSGRADGYYASEHVHFAVLEVI